MLGQRILGLIFTLGWISAAAVVNVPNLPDERTVHKAKLGGAICTNILVNVVPPTLALFVQNMDLFYLQ